MPYFPSLVSTKQKIILGVLDNHFIRKEAVELSTAFNIAERTVGSFLKSCLGKYLEQPEYGVYEKKLNI